MKKVVTILIIAVSAGACQKEEKNNLFQNNTPPLTTLSGTGYNGTHQPGKPCAGDPYNCVMLKEVVVKPHFQYYTDASAVASYFTAHSDDFPDMPTEILSKLQSGEYEMLKNYEDENNVNYCCGSSLPVTTSNFEFAIQF